MFVFICIGDAKVGVVQMGILATGGNVKITRPWVENGRVSAFQQLGRIDWLVRITLEKFYFAGATIHHHQLVAIGKISHVVWFV